VVAEDVVTPEEERVLTGFEAAFKAVCYLSIGQIDGTTRHVALQELSRVQGDVIKAMRAWRKGDR
jgi:hypothetical protein